MGRGRETSINPTPEEGVVSKTDKCILPTWTSFGYDTVIDCYNFRTEGEQVGGTLLKIKLNLTRDRMYSNIVTLKKWNRVIRRHAES